MQMGKRRSDDDSTFAAFVRAEYDRVYRAAYMFTGGNRELAQDAVQEAFAKALVRWPRLRSSEHVSGLDRYVPERL